MQKPIQLESYEIVGANYGGPLLFLSQEFMTTRTSMPSGNTSSNILIFTNSGILMSYWTWSHPGLFDLFLFGVLFLYFAKNRNFG